MSRLLTELEAEVRNFLQDEVIPYRHSTAELCRYYRDALGEISRERPDIVCGVDLSEACEADDDCFDGEFPLHGSYFRPVALFVAGSAKLKDDEFAASETTGNMMDRFYAALSGGSQARAAS